MKPWRSKTEPVAITALGSHPFFHAIGRLLQARAAVKKPLGTPFDSWLADPHHPALERKAATMYIKKAIVGAALVIGAAVTGAALGNGTASATAFPAGLLPRNYSDMAVQAPLPLPHKESTAGVTVRLVETHSRTATPVTPSEDRGRAAAPLPGQWSDDVPMIGAVLGVA